MLKVNILNVDPITVYNECIIDVSDPVVKNLLIAFQSEIVEMNAEYKDNAEVGKLLQTIRLHFKNNVNIKSALKSLYTDMMVKQDSKGRKYYDQIMALSKICTICKHQISSELDHFLPKSKYPLFAVSPYNLIPCCKDCNTAKSSYPFINKESFEQLIHPYFDDDIFFSLQWLEVEIIENDPIGIIYKVKNNHNSFSSDELKRIKKHFKIYKLNLMYSPQAVQFIFSKNYMLKNIYTTYGKEGVSNQLKLEFESQKEFHPNSWQTALLETLSKNDWFCDTWMKL